MSFADIILIVVAAGIAFVSCFIHALHSDIAGRREKEYLFR